MAVRERRAADIPALAAILARVAVDGYPPHRPTGEEEFVQASGEIAALVYELDEAVVGHVAVRERSARSVMAAAVAATGTKVESLGCVARLFVDPTMRRTGVATALLDAAVDIAHEAGRRPILDVWERLPAAIAFYESARWSRVALVDIRFRSPCTRACVHDDGSIRSFVYIAPDRSVSPERSS